MLNRRKARENAFILIFGNMFGNGEADELYNAAMLDRVIAPDENSIEEDDYTRDVYFGVASHTDEIDSYIERNSHAWSVSRISNVARAAMRLSVYEMLYRADVPVSVSLNEAIELVKKYDDEGARGFVNGVLNAVAKEIEELKRVNTADIGSSSLTEGNENGI